MEPVLKYAQLRLDNNVITRTENFKLFLKLLLFMFHATLIIMSRKYFQGFRSPQLPLDIRFWTQGFSLEIRSRKAGLPFATRSRKLELCFQSYASIITRTENFLSQKCSNCFWKLLQFMFQATLIIMSRKYFFGFQSPDSRVPLKCPFMSANDPKNTSVVS